MTDVVKENEEILRRHAQKDLATSEIAEALLEVTEGLEPVDNEGSRDDE